MKNLSASLQPLQNYCLHSLLVIVFVLVNPCFQAVGQTPGQIFDPATNVNSQAILDSLSNGWITASGSAFTPGILDESSEFDYSGWNVVYHVSTEPNSDLQTGSSCGATEIVDNPTTNEHAAYFRIVDPNGIYGDGDELIVFRMRVADEPGNASYGYSFLLDTDNAIGTNDNNSISGNPGFELEVLYASGNSGGVEVNDVDGVAAANQITTLASYSTFTNHQRAYALLSNCTGNNDVVFMDFYCSFADMGITVNTPVRFCFATSSSGNTALGGSASDIGGVDDGNFPNDDSAFVAIINATPQSSFSNYGVSGNTQLCGSSMDSCVNGTDTLRVWKYFIDEEAFENDADGWTMNGTTTPAVRHNGGPVLGDNYFLGRFASGDYIQKTFNLNSKAHRIAFELYRLDSWDNENLQIYVGDGTTLLINKQLAYNSGSFLNTGSSNGYSWSISALGSVDIPYTGNPNQSTWTDQVIKVYIDVPSGLSNLTLKITSTVDQANTDESWGMDNFGITCTEFTVPDNVDSINVIAVGGGGGGGTDGGSGGGGGEIRYGSIPVTPGNTYIARPGRGGSGGKWSVQGAQVGDPSALTFNGVNIFEANGGNGGGGWTTTVGATGGTGGTGGTGVTGATGGGGPGTCNTSAVNTGSTGSNGYLSTASYTCTPQYFGGGGGGGAAANATNLAPTLGPSGGQGGGGQGANYRLGLDGTSSITGFTRGFHGTSGTGGGGGGGAACDGGNTNLVNQRTIGGFGGSGVVIISYVTKPLSVSESSNTSVTCNGGADGALTVTAQYGQANYTYTWSNGSTTSNTTSTTNSISGLNAGTYTVTVTDASGSTASTTLTVSEPTSLVSSSAVTGTLACIAATDGEVTASATGGTSPYTYSWNTGGTGALENSLSAGTYSVTITDANGCADSSSVTLTGANQLCTSYTLTDSTLICSSSPTANLSITNSGTNNSSLIFNGTTDKVVVGDEIEGFNAITQEAWVRLDAYPSAYAEINTKEFVNSMAINSSGKLHFNLGSGAAWNTG